MISWSGPVVRQAKTHDATVTGKEIIPYIIAYKYTELSLICFGFCID